VGHGTNVRARTSYISSSPKVIVSRSHAGKVKSFIQDAFGNTTTITPAGGAGEYLLRGPTSTDVQNIDVNAG
jgi:inositol monophosphatase 3